MKPREFVIHLADESATVSLGVSLGELLREGGVVYLNGQLGAGKTTLCRGVLNFFGHSGAVKSPTYTLVEPYELNGKQIYHFDLYRLGEPEEIEYLGIRDYFDKENVLLIEWSERALGLLPSSDIVVNLAVTGTRRSAELVAASQRGEALLNMFSQDEKKSN